MAIEAALGFLALAVEAAPLGFRHSEPDAAPGGFHLFALALPTLARARAD